MRCEECGDDTGVLETYTTPDCVYRVRKCKSNECDWRCVTHEKYVDEYTIPKSVRNVNRKTRVAKRQQ